MPSNDGGFSMNPSTYKQVVANAQKLLEVVEQLGGVDTLSKDLASLKSSLEQTQTELTGVKDSVGELSDDLSKTNNALEKAQDDIMNMSKDIDEAEKSIKEIEDDVKELDEAVLNPPEDSDGSLVSSENGTKVIGVHINTANSEVNNLIADYNQGVTFEFKNTSVIGLKGKTGMSGDYCCVMTIKKDSPIEGETPDAIDADECQIAYGTDGVYLFKRSAQDDGSWGTWAEMPKAAEIEVRQQFVESDTEPTDQIAGEYWFENIGTV